MYLNRVCSRHLSVVGAMLLCLGMTAHLWRGGRIL